MQRIFRHTLFLLTAGEKKQLFTGIVLSLVIILLDISFLALLVLIINSVTANSPATGNSFPAALFLTQNLYSGLFFFISLFTLKNLAGQWVHQWQFRFIYKTASRISSKKLLQYLEGVFQNYSTKDSSVYIKQISQTPVEFAHYVLAGFQQFIIQGLLVILTITALVIYKAALLWMLVFILLPAVLFTVLYLKRKILLLRKETKKYSEQSLQYLKEAVSGYIESNLNNAAAFFSSRYSNRQEQLNLRLAALQSIHAVPSRLMEVFAVAGLFILIIINKSSGELMADNITMGFMLAAAYKIIPGLSKMLTAAGNITAYEFTISGLQEQENKSPAGKSLLQDTSINSVSFNDAVFSYKEASVLNHHTFSFTKGEMTGIAGASGRGKTTMLNLILGFAELQSGAVVINSKKLSAAERRERWPSVAYIRQEPFIIHDSLLSNITLSYQSPDEARLKNIITVCGLDDLVGSHQDGIHQIIMEDGKNISGGQRQKINIARALYKNAQVLLADEPFNELDEQMEKKLLLHFKELATGGKLIILVTHNKQSLAYCDKIIDLDEQ